MITRFRRPRWPRLIVYILLCALGFQVGRGLARITRADAEPSRPSHAASVFADERARTVIERYIEATGGREAHEAIGSRRIEGRLTIDGVEGEHTVRTWQAAPDRLSIEFDMGAWGVHRRGFDGEVGWESAGAGSASLLDAAATASLARRAPLSPFLCLDEHYRSVAHAGMVELDGQPTHKLELIPLEGEAELMYFDAGTGLEVRAEMTEAGPAGPITVVMSFGDYRAFDGVKLNTTLVTTVMGQTRRMTIVAVEHDLRLPDALFAPPEDAAPATR